MENKTKNISPHASCDELNITEHINYLSALIDKRITDASQKDALGNALEKIVTKNNDKILNMSVIGEFSTGKSTFINSLLRTELLTSCVLQGTTVANTVIEYNSNYTIEIHYKDKRSVSSLTYLSSDKMMKRIDELTTDPSVAKELETVKLTLPAENVKDNFRIIDTPGTNSLETWHEDVTKNALTQLSDVSVILVDASKPFPESLCNFINANLSDILSRCVFVLTKFDTIKPNERKMMLSYAEKKIKNEFGIDSPVVLPYCATAILENNNESDLYSISVESEKALMTHMAAQKQSAQTSKLIKLLDNIYTAIEQEMSTLSENCDRELQKLEQSRQADLSQFIEQQKVTQGREFWVRSSAEYENLASTFAEKRTLHISDTFSKLDALNTMEEIKKFIDEQLINKCKNQTYILNSSLTKTLEKVDEYYNVAVKKYEQEFTTHFHSLDLLVIPTENLKISSEIPEAHGITEINTDTSTYLSELLSQQSNRSVGGAALGATIGTVLLTPGFGTLVGGMLGSVFGRMFGPNIVTVKNDTKARLLPQLSDYFTKVEGQLLESYKQYIMKKTIRLRETMDFYLKSYHAIVDKMIVEQQLIKLSLNEQKKQAVQILSDISERKLALLSASKSF